MKLSIIHNPCVVSAYRFMLCIILLVPINSVAANDVSTVAVIHHAQPHFRYDFQRELLKHVLTLTIETHGPFTLQSFGANITEARRLQLLEEGDINVMFTPTDSSREKRFLAIKEPILRGILGYRIFLIDNRKANAFSSVMSLKELNTRFVAGFGEQWVDMKILESNHLRVIGSSQYKNLFSMLQHGRFDYFPRGVTEAWNEKMKYQSNFPELAVERHLAFYYPYPYYYFVNKYNTALAARIRAGLDKALADGSFKQLFFTYYAGDIKKADMPSRRVFRLDNPRLSEGTHEPDTHWWFPR